PPKLKFQRFLSIIHLLAGLVWVQGAGPVYVNSGGKPNPKAAPPNNNLITQTVYGFLDFTTTIANTVMVFSPQSQPAAEIKPSPTAKILQTKPPSTVQLKSVVQVKTAPVVLSSKVEVREGTSKVVNTKISPTKVAHHEPPKKTTIHHQAKAHSNTVQVKTDVKSQVRKPVVSSKVQVVTKSHEPAIFENNLEQAEYDFLSRQPSEVVDETYKVVEVGPTTKARHGVTGLVTKLGGTIVKEGVTTVHETSVIGTYISGKYAQILKSSSHVIHKPTPTVQKTAAVSPTKLARGLPLEALFSTPPAHNLVRQSRRPALSPPYKNRVQKTKPVDPPQPTRTQQKFFRLSHNRFGRPSSTEIATVSVFSENASQTRRYQRHRTGSAAVAPTQSVANNNIETGTRRFKPKPSQPNAVESSTSLYKFKLSRPQGRWHYKTSPKPRIAIRRQDEEGAQSSQTPSLPDLEESERPAEMTETQRELVATPTPSLPVQTIKVDISTPADFSNVYYEIAVIKSPYTFQVGTVKNTRYITVTSTQEKLLIEPTEASSTEPLTENILTTKPAYDKEASVATLPSIAIAGDETLPLETMTETFSTSEQLLKTHLLPVVKDSNTTTLTLVQTYEVTKLVTATKTLPPTELFQFVPSKTLNEFNTRLDEAGSELHLELEFGDNNNNDDEQPSQRTLPEFGNVTTEEPQLSVMSMSPQQPFLQEQLSPEKLQQLAFLRLLNPNQAPVFTSTPILSVHTVYESHVIPVFNGVSTVLSTISRPVGTVTSTQFLTNTVAIPSIPLPLFPTPQLQPQFTSTPVVTQTVVTETNSKVLKLTFGAKTAYTTLYSTKVVPTLLTTFIKAQLPVQQTAAPFPQFFPPFNPFTFVG
ncbi:hypothetical protein AAG570_008261, partial [Ranatra chinensis]